MEILIIKDKIQPKQRPRFWKGKVFTPSQTKSSEKRIAQEYKKQCKTFFTGKVEMEIRFYIGVKNKKQWGEPCLARPDCDNYEKTTCDSLNGVAYNDDSQVYKIKAQKIYAPFYYTVIILK
jgi:Holliday junction resolvase RusA-like endonuclease